MNILTNDTAIKLLCCAEAFGAMVDKGQAPTEKELRLAVDAMAEAIPALQGSDGTTSEIERLRAGLERARSAIQALSGRLPVGDFAGRSIVDEELKLAANALQPPH